MFKKHTFYGALFTLLLLNTGCFDILEEINLNKDGSGTVLITLNMSKSKTKLASIMLLDSINGRKVPSEDDIELALNDVVAHLKKSKGISNIKQTKDFKNYIFSVSCDFQDVSSLNGITAQLIRDQNKRENTKFNTTNFAYNASAGTFERKFTYDNSIRKSFDYLHKEDKKVFDDASFTAIYRFEDLVEKTSNTISKIAPSRKAVMLRVDAMSFIFGKETIQNTITLKN